MVPRSTWPQALKPTTSFNIVSIKVLAKSADGSHLADQYLNGYAHDGDDVHGYGLMDCDPVGPELGHDDRQTQCY